MTTTTTTNDAASRAVRAIVERRRLALRQVQGPPLTPDEAERLRQLDEWLARIDAEVPGLSAFLQGDT